MARSEEHTSELQSRQDLHSFPTRRSSDLGRARPDSPDPTGGAPRQWHAGEGALRASASISCACRSCQRDTHKHWPGSAGYAHPPAWPAPPAPAGQWRDRKSTRLNSSHAKIYTLSLHDALPISVEHVQILRTRPVELLDNGMLAKARFERALP